MQDAEFHAFSLKRVPTGSPIRMKSRQGGSMLHRYAFIAVASLWLAAPAVAETIEVSDGHGGSVARYNARWAGLAARGVNVRIVGPCQSACTVLLGHIPRSRICVTPNASFGFHLARLQSATDMLRNAYQPDIRAWIDRRGGLSRNFIWMRAPDTYRFFKKC
jgi:hypothetical protein